MASHSYFIKQYISLKTSNKVAVTSAMVRIKSYIIESYIQSKGFLTWMMVTDDAIDVDLCFSPCFYGSIK